MNFLEGFNRAVAGRQRVPTDPNGVARLFGPPAQQNSRLAMELAGTTDRRSREYKSALRSVQRWRRGQYRPSVANQSRLERAARQRMAQRRKVQQLRQHGGRVTFYGRIRVSDDVRDRGFGPQWVAPELLNPALDAWEAGREEEARGRLTEAFGIAYGAPFDELDDPQVFEFEAGTPEDEE
jgi:hypothetical protein